MTIGVLSSGKISIPLIQALAQHRLLAWVAITDETNEGIETLMMYLQNVGIPFFAMKKENFVSMLHEKIMQTNVFSLFVLGFPWKLPTEILESPMLGCWNFHFGALPEYRGNAPVFWQIKNRENFAMLTVHKMTQKFDEGAIAHTAKTPILVHDTFGTVEKKLSFLAIDAMSVLVNHLLNDTLTLTEQNHSLAKVYKKPVAIDVSIDWQNQTAAEIRALVSATNPWNKGAYTRFQQQYFRFLQVTVLENKKKVQAKAGTILKADNEGLWVMSKDNVIVNVEILYTEDGYFTGTQMAKFGVTKGQSFE